MDNTFFTRRWIPVIKVRKVQDVGMHLFQGRFEAKL